MVSIIIALSKTYSLTLGLALAAVALAAIVTVAAIEFARLKEREKKLLGSDEYRHIPRPKPKIVTPEEEKREAKREEKKKQKQAGKLNADGTAKPKRGKKKKQPKFVFTVSDEARDGIPEELPAEKEEPKFEEGDEPVENLLDESSMDKSSPDTDGEVQSLESKAEENANNINSAACENDKNMHGEEEEIAKNTDGKAGNNVAPEGSNGEGKEACEGGEA